MSDSKRCSKCKSTPCCCLIENENETNIRNNPTNTNTFNPTFNPTINVNPIFNIPSPTTGEQGLLTEFDADVITELSIVLTPNENTPFASTVLHIDDSTDRVWLTASIPWQVINVPEGGATANFKIFRNGSPSPIISIEDSGRATPNDPFGENNKVVTSFTFVDKTPPIGTVTYTLTGIKSGGNGDPNVLFNVVFTASEIEANNPTNP